jgi:hypothetical protein
MRVRFAHYFLSFIGRNNFLAFSKPFSSDLKRIAFLIALVSDQPPLIKSILLFGFLLLLTSASYLYCLGQF